MPRPVSATEISTSPRQCGCRNGHGPAATGELNCIAEQIEQDLQETGPISVDCLRDPQVSGRAADPNGLGVGQWGNRLDYLTKRVLKRKLLGAEIEEAGLNTGKIENIADQ